MSKFKVGDKVRVINETYGWKKGETFIIKNFSNDYYTDGRDWGIRTSNLELAPFTQKDLEVGMLCETENNNWWTIDDEYQRIGNADNRFVIAIYHKDKQGNLIKIWERKEKRYTLQCPVTKQYLVGREDDGYKWLNEIEIEFTQKEIDNMPNQGFISQLIKEEVE